MELAATNCYRKRPFFRNVGLAHMVLCLGMGIFSVCLAWFNVDGSFRNPLLAALVGGAFWLAFSLIGVWLVLLYYRYRLLLDSDEILQVGVVRRQHVQVWQIEELKWRCIPAGGSVKLRGLFGVVVVELGNFVRSDRQEVIAFFRSAVDPARQTGWERFDEHFNRVGPHKPRSRWATICSATMFLLIGVAFLALWLLTGRGLAMSLINIAYGEYSLATGCRHSSRQEVKQQINGC
jgi:hypothetical protein